MSMTGPKTCMHCGVNFMKRNPNDEKEKICNSCQNKENLKKGVDKMSNDKVNVDVSIGLDHDEFSRLEEACNNKGINFSEYFLGLHQEKQGKKDDEIQDEQETKKKQRKS